MDQAARAAEEGQYWSSCDKLKAIRLLGKQPAEAVNEADVATIFLATYTIVPQYNSPFGAILCDVPEYNFKNYEALAIGRAPDLGLSGDPAIAKERARELLRNIVEGEISKLQAKADDHRQRIARRAAMSPAQLGFDASPEGERIRRYETSCARLLLRTLAEFNKMRRADESDGEPVEAAGFLADIAETIPMSAVVPNLTGDNGSQPDERTAMIDEPPVRNEARLPAGNECMSAAGECAATSDEARLRNEARPPAGVGCGSRAADSAADTGEARVRNEARQMAGRVSRVESRPTEAGTPLTRRKRNFLPACREEGRNRKERRRERRQCVGV